LTIFDAFANLLTMQNLTDIDPPTTTDDPTANETTKPKHKVRSIVDEEQTFSIGEAAIQIGVSERTAKRYIASGDLGYYGTKKYKTTKGVTKHGRIRIGKSHIDAYLRKMHNSTFTLPRTYDNPDEELRAILFSGADPELIAALLADEE
jgi:hypothetical protein